MKNRFQIKWTQVAAIDLSEIIEFIAIENPNTAKLIYKKIKSEVSQLKLLFLFRNWLKAKKTKSYFYL